MAPKTYTTAEVAAKVGVSRQTLYSWIEEGKITAPKPIKLGQRTMRIWNQVEMEHARKFKGSLKPGPKPS
jgi:excisionase family DNA binding protein